MTTIQNFPVFAGNQVLRHDHLNNLVNYLESQSRLTRNKTIGIGIVAGFLTELVSNKLVISEGVGITSMGYLIYSKPLEYTHYKVYSTDRELSSLEKDFKKSGAEFDTLRKGYDQDYVELSKVYEFILGPINTVATGVYELTTDTVGATPLSSLSANDWSTKVLVAYLNADIKSLKNCTGDNCDDSGATLEFDLRFLLVEKTVADAMLDIQKNRKSVTQIAMETGKMASNSGGTVATSSDFIAPPFIERLLFPANIPVNFAQLADVYRVAVIGAMNNVRSKIDESRFKYPLILNHIYTNCMWDEFRDNINNVISLVDNTSEFNIQYYYDFAAHLVDAFNEFREKVLEYDAVCYPAENAFPRHLMLGILAKIGDDMSMPDDSKYGARETHIMTGGGYFPLSDIHLSEKYRTDFIPAPHLQKQTELREEIWTLHYRMFEMLRKFNPDLSLVTLKYLPSKTKAYPLSSRNAIPYYFNALKTYNDSRSLLFRLWSYRKTRKDEFQNLDSYQTIGAETSLTGSSNPLRARLTDQNLYRFEGHIGRDVEYVITQLVKKRKDYGLDFKIRVANLNERLSSTQVLGYPIELFKDVLTSDPGIEPMAGVPKGGTFVVLFEEYGYASDELTSEEISSVLGVIELTQDKYNYDKANWQALFIRTLEILRGQAKIPGTTWKDLFNILDGANAGFANLDSSVETIDDGTLSAARMAQSTVQPFQGKTTYIKTTAYEPFITFTINSFNELIADRPEPEVSRTVVADFALDYACCESAPKVVTGGGPVSYVQCEYEIFGVVSIEDVRKKLLVVNGIELTITRYTIQDQVVAGSPKVITVMFNPTWTLERVIEECCSAVNAAFPTGLLFSRSVNNKLLIKRIQNQKFEFVVHAKLSTPREGFDLVYIPYVYFDNMTGTDKSNGVQTVVKFYPAAGCVLSGSNYNKDDYYNLQTTQVKGSISSPDVLPQDDTATA